MKRQFNLLSNLVHWTAGASVLCMLAFNAQAVTRNYTVNVRVDGTQTNLEITTDTSQLGNCNNAVKSPPSNELGCARVAEYDDANINIQLMGNPHCDDGHWKLSGFYLGGFNEALKPPIWGNLQQVVVDDFTADQVSGLAGTIRSDHHIHVIDENSATYIIWYKVEAVCVNSDGEVKKGPIQTDPQIKNEG